MSTYTPSLQSRFLFANCNWQTLYLDSIFHDLEGIDLEHFVQISWSRVNDLPLFDVIVREQCPKDNYRAFLKVLHSLTLEKALVLISHSGSPNLHLMAWSAQDEDTSCHLELNLQHPSKGDSFWVDLIGKDVGRAYQLLLLCEGSETRSAFFKAIQKQLDELKPISAMQRQTVLEVVLGLVFLLFVQTKGWLNFDPIYLFSRFELCQRKGLSILNAFVKPLFASLEGQPIREVIPLGDLPMLGGGLFHLNWSNCPIIANDWFFDLYKYCFIPFSFSLMESGEDDQVFGICPEILGHVFENLMEENDRKQYGVFYTPGQLVHHQVALAFENWKKQIHQYKKDHKLALEQIRVLDPACGSGSYLVAALKIILCRRLEYEPARARFNGSLFRLKKEIVTNNLFGMDIHPFAVKLSEVRLWLNMIQDLDVSKPSLAPELPSLQHHLRAGNYLFQHTAKLDRWPKYKQVRQLLRKYPESPGTLRKVIFNQLLRLEGELNQFLSSEELRDQVPQLALPGLPIGSEVPSGEKPLGGESFQPHTQFFSVLERGGFDLIIGNPPWLGSSKIPGSLKKIIRKSSFSAQPSYGADQDLALHFISASWDFLKKDVGHLSFVLPGKFMQAKYGKALRSFVTRKNRLAYVLDYGQEHNYWFQADTFPVVLGLFACGVKRDFLYRSVSRKAQVQEQHKQGFWSERPWTNWQIQGETLEELPFRIFRGVVTGAKAHFCMSEVPKGLHGWVKPLLQGRDLGGEKMKPSKWIFWPFDKGPLWHENLPMEVENWIRANPKIRFNNFRPLLPYGPKPLGRWCLLWKYLGKTFQPYLVQEPTFIPDQTTYFMPFENLEKAWSIYIRMIDVSVKKQLEHICQRGKDGFRFFYASSVSQVVLPQEKKGQVPANIRDHFCKNSWL